MAGPGDAVDVPGVRVVMPGGAVPGANLGERGEHGGYRVLRRLWNRWVHGPLCGFGGCGEGGGVRGGPAPDGIDGGAVHVGPPPVPPARGELGLGRDGATLAA